MTHKASRCSVLPKKPCYELSGEYIESKAVTATLPMLYVRGDHISERNVSMTNFKAKQSLSKAEMHLKIKREQFVGRKRDLDRQWFELKKQEKELRRMFIKYNSFLIENEEKRARASQTISDMTKTEESRDEQIEMMNEKCTKLEATKCSMNQHITMYKIYEEYLNQVLEQNVDDFGNVQDILKRYDDLTQTGKELTVAQVADAERLAEKKHEMAKIIDAYIIKISGMTTRVALLQQRHEEAKRMCQKWEELCERAKESSAEQIVDMVSVKDSCKRIYVDICERKGTRPVFKDDCEKQLEVIKRTLRDYRCINDIVKKVKAEVTSKDDD